jgi:hypothetical protein
MDLYDFLNHDSMGGGEADPRYPNRRGSSVWGWVGPKGRQIGLIGQHTGTAFVEIDKKGKLTYLGRLPAQDPLGSSWREIRVLNNYAIIGSEAVGHNVQVFDLNKVAAIDPKKPKTFNKETDLTGLFDDLPIGRAHNVSQNHAVEESYHRLIHGRWSSIGTTSTPLLLAPSLVTRLAPPAWNTSTSTTHRTRTSQGVPVPMATHMTPSV